MILTETIAALARNSIFIALGVSGIGFLIGFHELGHFLFCKLFNVATPSFSIGFGPKLISKKIGETEFSISAIPLGGYVEIAGAAEVGQGEQEHAFATGETSFANKPFYQKFAIMFGGILFNIVFAYTTMTLLFLSGTPKSPLLFPFNVSPIIETVAPESAAEKYGLQAGDRIISVEQTMLNHEVLPLLDIIRSRPNQSTELIIERAGEHYSIAITPDATPLPNNTQKSMGTLGVTFQPLAHDTILGSIKHAISLTNTYIKRTGQGLIDMVTQRNFSSLGGPIMIISLSSKSAAEGLQTFFILLAIISINLALLNLIPLPIFDGGQILFYGIEAILGRSLSPRVREYIHMATWLMVLFLVVVLSIRDISHIASPYIESIKQFLGMSK
jgi:regulator of sigma E protease